MIICIVGMPCSGKGVVAKIIKKNFNADVFSTGDVIRDEIKARGLKYTKEMDAKIAHWFHTEGREKLIVQRTWQKAKSSSKKIIVIEGFRSPEEFNLLEKLFCQKPIIIEVKADFKTRAEREIARGRFGKEESVTYLKSRDKLELSHGLGKLIAMADYTIDNSSNIKNLEKNINNLIGKLIK